ncbi:MAG: hypothetical protein Q9213_002094 [Squamulea squamosa]
MESISSIDISEAQQRVEQTPSESIAPPTATGTYEVDDSVIECRLADGVIPRLKNLVVTLGSTGRSMCEGEYKSLVEIYEVSPEFVPRPYAWGRYRELQPEVYFLLTEFRDIGDQPAEPVKLANQLADLHQRSKSPTGKFGFHFATCHAKIAQKVDSWEDSWCTLYSNHLGHVMDLARPLLQWPEFDVVCKLTLEKVVPRLLLPLQSDGRVLKPCLVHGDCWDGNTAMDIRTGQAFVFDVCSFYGHNEYDTGNWRAPRHRLSNKAYIRNYKKNFPVSEPEEDWDARNLLYSLTFNIGNTIYIPGSSQRQVRQITLAHSSRVYDDMTTLCQMFCADDLNRELKRLREDRLADADEQATAGAKDPSAGDEDDEEEAEEEEEEEEEEDEEE